MSLQNMECGHTTKEKKASLRKSNKPIMEKKRRARINSCLSQLKTLVLEAMRKDSSQYSKLEKADILEMTVKHLRNLQRQQMSTALASDPNVVSKYRAGFKECAGEVVKYLNTSQSVNDDMRSRIMNHLSGVVPSVNTHAQSQHSTAATTTCDTSTTNTCVTTSGGSSSATASDHAATKCSDSYTTARAEQ
ncbi:transcription factor HES-1-B-like [Pecten maximus]|uniref:transcription factor HES-1-B-like n=1 Tax=Pecten maximus TaxID=6579 RepID=UPI001458E96B|nr:transcription factor HES-1-B-like [Pecten maximus]